MKTLPTSLAEFPFVGGVETKVDPFQIPPNRLAVAKDCIFNNPGEINTRYGYAALNNQYTRGALTRTIANGQALMTFRDELVLCDSVSLYSWDPGQSTWVWVGPCTSLYLTTAPVVQTGQGQQAPDENVSPNGTRCDAWEDAAGGAWYSVTNVATGKVLVPPKQIHARGLKPKVLCLGETFVILYVRGDTSRLYLAPLSSGSPFAALVSTAITAASSPTSNTLKTSSLTYDACVIPNTALGPALYVAFLNNIASSGAGITVQLYTPASLTSPLITESTLLGGTTPQALTIFADCVGPAYPFNGPVLLWWDGGNVNVAAYQYLLTSLTVGITLVEATETTVVSLTGVNVGSTTAPAIGGSRLLYCYYSLQPGSAPSNDLVHVATVLGNTPTVSAPATLRRSVVLATKAFALESPAGVVSYVGLSYQSVTPSSPGLNGLQNTAFIADQTGYVVGRFFAGTAGGHPPLTGVGPNAVTTDYGAPLLPEVWAETSLTDSGTIEASGTVFGFAALQCDALYTYPTTTPPPGTQLPLTGVFTQFGVTSVGVDFFDPQNSYRRAELGDTLLISGGCLQQYDGQTVTENGFHLYPENIALSFSASGGHVPDGTIWYVFVYQWQNASGDIEYSSPSVPISIAVSGGGGSASVTATVPTLRLTGKTNVQIVAYRAVLTGTVYHQAVTTTAPAASGATNQPILNDPTVDTVTFVDNLADSAIAGTVELYTTGNVLENGPVPPLADLTVNFNRVLGVDSTDPLRFWFSQQTLPGEPVQMSEWLSDNVDPRGGALTAIRALDQHTVLFKESLIMATDGIGPDSTGGQGSFGDAYIVTTDAGCAVPRSIGLGPYGLYFQSLKGLYHLDKGLNVTYVGAPAEALVAGHQITSTELVPYTQQMRFTEDAGYLTFHDYFVNQWGEHTNVNAVDAAVWQGTYCYLQPGGKVMQETVGLYADNGRFVGLSVTSPWDDLAGLAGWARTYWAYLTGKPWSACRLLWQLAFDYDPSVKQSGYIDIQPGGVYGGLPYGVGVFGGLPPEKTWRIQPNQQRSSAMQLTLTVLQAPGGGAGQGLSLSARSYEWGKSPTPRKPNSSATFG